MEKYGSGADKITWQIKAAALGAAAFSFIPRSIAEVMHFIADHVKAG